MNITEGLLEEFGKKLSPTLIYLHIDKSIPKKFEIKNKKRPFLLGKYQVILCKDHSGNFHARIIFRIYISTIGDKKFKPGEVYFKVWFFYGLEGRVFNGIEWSDEGRYTFEEFLNLEKKFRKHMTGNEEPILQTFDAKLISKELVPHDGNVL